MQNCKNCHHWEEQQNERGRCTGDSPKATVIQGQDMTGRAALNVITYWPETSANERCGVWKVKQSSLLPAAN